MYFPLEKRHQSWSLYYRTKKKKIKPEKKATGLIARKNKKTKMMKDIKQTKRKCNRTEFDISR